MAEAPPSPLLALLGLMRQARRAGSAEELGFLLVNDSRALAPYRQAALWWAEGGIQCLSGVVQAEANTPYAHWVQRVCAHLWERQDAASTPAPTLVTAADLPDALAREWGDWLPAHALWLPLAAEGAPGGGLLLAGDEAWQPPVIALLGEWLDGWQASWRALRGAGGRRARRVGAARGARPGRPRWWRPRWLLALTLVAALAFPVRLTVLAPGELVAAHPALVRAPLDGVIDRFQVEPNQAVKAGQPLFSFDQAALSARRDVALQALDAAQAEYRQFEQQALADGKSKAQLAALAGKIEERRAEAGYVSEQFERSQVSAPQDGVALFDDPTEWLGKPVQTGERVMRVARADDVEVEIWVPLGDAIDMPAGTDARLYLSADPLASIAATVRYVSYAAQLRPDGVYAFRVRATLDGAGRHRVGSRGTAKILGPRVPVAYWMLRRPLATIRQALGL
jgi:hypothetical protein